jgi:hypothetical protein
MVNLLNIQPNPRTLKVELAGGSGTRQLLIPAFATRQITDAEYTQNPDYYNSLVTQGALAINSPDILNDVQDEPANHQKGTATS